MTSRRAFLARVAAAVAGVAVDPELLAWEPGKRVFFDLFHRPQLLRVQEVGYNWEICDWQQFGDIQFIKKFGLGSDPASSLVTADQVSQAAQRLADDIDRRGLEAWNKVKPLYTPRAGVGVSEDGYGLELQVVEPRLPPGIHRRSLWGQS